MVTLELIGGLVVYGLVTGSIYGLAGTGITLTYASTGILNFAYPALFLLSGWLFYWMVDVHQLPWPVGMALCTLAAGPLIGIGFARLGRSLIRVHSVLQVAVMIGILVSVDGLIAIVTGSAPDTVAPFLPTSGVSIGGIVISIQDWVVLAMSAGTVAVLYFWLRFTTTGLSIRAVVADQDLAELSGIRSARTQRTAWMVSCSLAMFAGVLFAPTINLLIDSVFGIVLGAFAAAAIGSFVRLPSTFFGGLLIGIMVSIASYYAATIPSISAVPTLVPLVVLLVVMIAKSRTVAEEGGRGFVFGGVPRLAGVRGPLLGLVVLGAVLIQVFHVSQMTAVSVGFAYVIIFLGLNVLMRSGQVSLGQAAVAAVGGAALAHFGTTELGLPWAVAVILGMLIAAVVGVAMAVVGARLSGIYVALATLAAGYVIQVGAFQGRFFYGVTGSAQAPVLSGTALPYYVGLVVAVAAIVWLIRQYRGRFGRLLASFAEGSSGVRAFGLSTWRLRLLIFAIAGMLAAFGGALLGGITGSESTQSFDFTLSLLWFAAVALGAGTLTGAVIPGLAVGIVPVLFPTTSQYLVVALGVFAVIVGLIGARSYGADAGVQELGEGKGEGEVAVALEAVEPEEGVPPLDDLGESESPNGVEKPSGALAPVFAKAHEENIRVMQEAASRGAPVLSVKQATVQFGGLLALNDVSFEIPFGQITGLIGPNGSGKSTLVSAIGGTVRLTSGEVEFEGRPLGTTSADRRARMGIGRTFQSGSLFGALTVLENVLAAWECGQVGAQPWRALCSSRKLQRHGVEIAREALKQTGTEALSAQRAKDLSTGDQRMVEIARILAGGFNVALLDECASGLDALARARFAELLLHVSANVGVTLVVVEHDLSLIEQVADELVVLGLGRLVSHGKTTEVLRSDDVQQLYVASPSDLSSEASLT